MVSFTTRVELHSANWHDYETLHQAMEGQGFSRFIRSYDGTWFHLSTAEYDFEGNLTIEQIRDRAIVAVNSTGKGHSILVSQSVARSWIGLPRVDRK